jgi:hypothetical protein
MIALDDDSITLLSPVQRYDSTLRPFDVPYRNQSGVVSPATE